jgi:hypothetical protein
MQNLFSEGLELLVENLHDIAPKLINAVVDVRDFSAELEGESLETLCGFQTG